MNRTLRWTLIVVAGLSVLAGALVALQWRQAHAGVGRPIDLANAQSCPALIPDFHGPPAKTACAMGLSSGSIHYSTVSAAPCSGRTEGVSLPIELYGVRLTTAQYRHMTFVFRGPGLAARNGRVFAEVPAGWTGFIRASPAGHGCRMLPNRADWGHKGILAHVRWKEIPITPAR